MKWTEDKLDVLQNIEFAMISIWRAHPDMNDYAALRVYQALHQMYRAESRGHPPKPHGLDELEAETFEAVKAMCEFRLGRGPCPVEDPGPIPSVSVEDMAAYVKELSRSVERHTKRGGRQGYLTFINQFLP